jgi:hypothetical protein
LSVIFVLIERTFISSIFLIWSRAIAHESPLIRVTRRFEKKLPDFSKSSPNSLQAKKGQNINLKAQNIYINHFWSLKIPTKTYFGTAYLSENVINLLKEKVAQNVAISLGYFIFSKNHNESKSNPIGEKSPNLVTLPIMCHGHMGILSIVQHLGWGPQHFLCIYLGRDTTAILKKTLHIMTLLSTQINGT